MTSDFAGALTTVERFTNEANGRRASDVLSKARDILAANELASSGMSQRRISQVLGLSVATVNRYLNRDERDLTIAKARSIILGAYLDGTDRGQMVNALATMRHTFTETDPDGLDNALSGSWGVVAAAVGAWITEDEWKQISDRVGRGRFD